MTPKLTARLSLVLISLSASSAFATINPDPTNNVPDTGSAVGLLGLGVLVMLALRRKFTK